MKAPLAEARLRAGLQRAGRRAAMMIAGALLLAVGIGFLTAAGWLLLADAFGPLVAAAVLAGIYGGTGLVLLALAGRAPPPQPLPATPATAPESGIGMAVDAFVFGYQAARGVPPRSAPKPGPATGADQPDGR